MRMAADFAGPDGVAHGVLLDGGECAVPDEVCDAPSFTVRLTGYDGERVVVTDAARVVQEVM